MSQKLDTKQVIAVVVVAFGIVVGLVMWSTSKGSDSGKTIIVKPDNPNDSRYRPDPKLGGGGG